MINRDVSRKKLTARVFRHRVHGDFVIAAELETCEMAEADAPAVEFYDIDLLKQSTVSLANVDQIIMRER